MRPAAERSFRAALYWAMSGAVSEDIESLSDFT